MLWHCIMRFLPQLAICGSFQVQGFLLTCISLPSTKLFMSALDPLLNNKYATLATGRKAINKTLRSSRNIQVVNRLMYHILNRILRLTYRCTSRRDTDSYITIDNYKLDSFLHFDGLTQCWLLRRLGWRVESLSRTCGEKHVNYEQTSTAIKPCDDCTYGRVMDCETKARLMVSFWGKPAVAANLRLEGHISQQKRLTDYPPQLHRYRRFQE